MAYNEKEMLRDFNGVVIPTQYYDETADVFVLDSSTSATAAVIGTLATEATLTSTASALGTTADADTTLTVIGRLKKILATLEAGITVTESTPLTTIGTTVADGDNTALGTTTDADTVTTVIGLLKKLQSVLEGGIGVTESSPLTTIAATIADGSDVALGTTTDADTSDTAIGILKALKGKDFATQTTLATLATETKAEAIRALLATISGLDFAEETTLSGMSGNVGTTSDDDSDTTVIGRLQKLITDLGTLADSKTLSDIITAIDYESGISATGAIGTITATTTASAAIAGGTALANRKGMEILNNSANVVYWGYEDTVTTATGMPINPGISKNFEFKPSVATAIYVIAASDSELYIHEWK